MRRNENERSPIKKKFDHCEFSVSVLTGLDQFCRFFRFGPALIAGAQTMGEVSTGRNDQS